MSVNRATRNLVRSRANFLCEYCNSAEESSSTLFMLAKTLKIMLSWVKACKLANSGFGYGFLPT